MNTKKSFVPPRPGIYARHICKDCGRGFDARIPVFNFLEGIFGKCPFCGGPHILQDKRAQR
jgi:hypothetical protein